MNIHQFIQKYINFGIALIVVGAFALGYWAFNEAAKPDPTIAAAQAYLATKCVKVPDGRILSTVDVKHWPNYAKAGSRYLPAMLLKNGAGEDVITGTIFTIDGRKVEPFTASSLKIVACPD